MQKKLAAAVDAKQDKEFIIVARTDARATEGLDDAIERGKYYRKIGADLIFVEAPKSIEEMKKIGKSINAPLVANMIEGGATPISSTSALHKMGFQLILYPLSNIICKYICNYENTKGIKKQRHHNKTKERFS